MNFASEEETRLEKSLENAVEQISRAIKEKSDWPEILAVVVAQFDARLRYLEDQRFEYCGVYEPQKQYRKGQFVTFRGAMWHAQIDAKGCSPGDGIIWKMAVKAGRR